MTGNSLCWRSFLSACAAGLLAVFVGVAQETPPIQGTLKMQDAEFQGNAVTTVKGTGQLTNSQGQTIAKGDLTVVDGWVALRGVKGSQFQALASDLADKLEVKWHGEPTGVAIVTLIADRTFRLDDENFHFVFDTGYGASLDLAASLARAPDLRVTKATEIGLWGSTVSVGKNGGSIRIVRGTITGGKNITVTTPGQKVRAFQ